jgi:hypothetical protein
MHTNVLYAIKEVMVPALTSMVINTKFKGITSSTTKPIATIHAPQNPMISGMPAILAVDKNNNCKVVIDNCAP